MNSNGTMVKFAVLYLWSGDLVKERHQVAEYYHLAFPCYIM